MFQRSSRLSILAVNVPIIYFQDFLAAMSSSRSDVVTKCVRLCVRVSLFFLLVSLKFLVIFKSFNDVSRVFKGCLKFKGSFKDVSRKFKGCLQKTHTQAGSSDGVSPLA